MHRVEFHNYYSEDELISLISDLVAIPSHPGVAKQESAVAQRIDEFFQSEGIESEVIPVIDGRSNVIARLPGTGKGRTLLLTGHTDTVPPYDMEGNPFAVSVRQGRMYGRGTVDMKGSLACMMIAMAAIKRSGLTLQGDVVFAGVIDEEDKSEGTRALLKQKIHADAAIVGEPTELQICTGHRGLEWLEFIFHGKTVHGGKQKEGINAIQKAGRFIAEVESTLIPYIEARTHPVCGHSSMNYGVIQGGTQPSTVAGECILKIDRRWIPGEKYKDVLAEYQAVLDRLHQEDPQFQVEMKVMEVSLMEPGIIHEAMDTDPESPIVSLSKAAIEQVLSQEASLTTFTAWSDGGLLSSYGKIPTIVLGPGNLESAHSADEHLEIASAMMGTAVYALTATLFCGVDSDADRV